jgi:hypothetical protein
MQNDLHHYPESSILITMNTLTHIIETTIATINNEIIEDLVVELGYDYGDAVKVVTEFKDFDFDFVMDTDSDF